MPSPKAMLAVSEKVQTPSLSSIVSLSSKKMRVSVSSMISSASEVHPFSSVADPTVIANLLPNKGESEILYSSEWWKSEDRMLREYIYLRVMKNCFLMVAVFPWMKLVNHHQSNMDLSIWSFWFLCFKICIMISSQFWVSDFW